jgi:uncharacterized protein
MSDKKEILLKGNAAIAEGNYEYFVSLCTDDTEWIFAGEQTLKGKEAVRQWMKDSYEEPPEVRVDTLIAEGDFLTAVGEVVMKNRDGSVSRYAYCDVWQFRNDRIAGLRAFVVTSAGNTGA